MRAPDWLYRFAYRHGIRLARVWWWLRRPRTSGAHVLIWHEGRVLLLRTSYRAGWTTPGGGIRRGEDPVGAALREAREEVGVRLRPGDLKPIGVFDHTSDFRQDTLHLFEVELESSLRVEIDNREIVEARFVALPDTPSYLLESPVRCSLDRKLAEVQAHAGLT